MIILIPLACFAVFCLLWPVMSTDTPAKSRKRIVEAQRKVLQRHMRDLERKAKRHTSIWKRHPNYP
jgi:hypothetical protein